MSKEELAKLIIELHEVSKEWNFDDDIPEAQKCKCVEIGKELNALGGYETMLIACYAVNENNRAVANSLNFIWHGIGSWQM